MGIGVVRTRQERRLERRPREFVETFGRVAWRRPLEEDEIAAYVAVAEESSQELGGFDDGIEYAAAALLQSPSFLYQVEIGDADPARPGVRRLRGHELAT